MKKLPNENQGLNATFTIVNADNGFVSKSIERYVNMIGKFFSRGKYWDNLDVLDNLIHAVRQLLCGLEKRKSELLKRKAHRR
ncbi:MAG: hypothetical protein UV80_C0002G0067 [Candidatus Peregrinibacteria bacterium GW2011_GWF2_43_17]|nr:MAG: hypothetical protein UV80_C0002G0067 [Candidatus Peregrinibacteria bacterium GW2011_GWF2_43_17]KKT20595.1 MAG: hypothetical protein UW03_C0002G0061 [Candidatus Peregrinibacteria bacterium GW2011_GWA2_43_8]HAU39886.1 hypothetical protein [Candidatus Peregrinibacteria bacterium]